MRLIFRAQDVDTTGFDAKKSSRARTTGDLIEILEDGQFAGKKVEPSSSDWEGIHVIVNVPDISLADATIYRKQLRHFIDWIVVSSNDEGWRLRVRDVHSGTITNISKNQVEEFILKFNGVIQSFATNEVIFDIGVFGAATSNGFWHKDVTPVTFQEVNHDSTGYRIRADLPNIWTDTIKKRRIIQSRIIGHGCSIVSFNIPQSCVTYDVPRDAAIGEFKEQARDKLENIIIKRSQFYIEASEISTILASGGEMNINKATLLTKIKNKLDD